MELNTYTEKPFVHFDKDWALLTAGVPEDFNSMTIGWGALGTMWGNPSAFLVVRPSRYTLEFLKKYEEATLSWYDEKYKKALGVFGSKSGRDVDKAAETGFTPVPAGKGVTYREARETMVLRRLFMQQLDRSKFPEEVCQKWYPAGTENEEGHILVIAEVLSHQ